MLMDAPALTARSESAAPTPSAWLDGFGPGSSLFVSPGRALIGQGNLLSATGDAGPAAQQARELLHEAAVQGADHPILLGLIPFDATRPARLFVPERYESVPTLARAAHEPDAAGAVSNVRAQRSMPDATGYEDSVRQALAMMRAGPELHKLVLARTLELDLDDVPDLQGILARLLRDNPAGYTYAIPLESAADAEPALFFGASPELLVRREGRRVTVNPLAGTAARHPDPAEDRRRADALLASAKDQYEHAIVIGDVVQRLRPLCSSLHVPDGPSLISTPTLWHLSTLIEGRLTDPGTSSLDLALALHPTPAVCGQPMQLARSGIRELESFDRGFYAGAAGWCDAHGDGEWAVAIRCAQYRDRRLTLYAGAGIVPGSDPVRERIETRNKLGTVLDALGLDTPITID
ncbi:MAG: isochorismate synthase [Alcaligenaceae bacterium]|nr:isochorismate synthase [Alcaligenaceae bacterium]